MIYARRSFFDLVFFKASGWWFGIFLAIGLVMVPVTAAFSLRAMRLETRGATVTGTVIERRETTRKCGKHNRSTCHTYAVTYAYRLADGSGQRLTENVSADLFFRLREKGPVQVHYLPEDLSVAEIDWGASRTKSWWLDVSAIAFLLFGGINLVARVRRVRQIIWLHANGTLLTTTVSGHVAAPWLLSGKNVRCAAWYEDIGGRGQTDPRRIAELPQPGSTISVYADPRRKFAPVWQEDVM